MPIKLKANNGNIDLKVPIKQTGGGAVNSVNGQTGDVVLDIPSKTSDLVNDSGFLTQHQDLSSYAKKSDIPTQPDLTLYALKTEIPDVSGYALKSEIPSLADYSTTTQVQSMINTAIGSITDGNEVSY